jgi:hypothetical protein
MRTEVDDPPSDRPQVLYQMIYQINHGSFRAVFESIEPGMPNLLTEAV